MRLKAVAFWLAIAIAACARTVAAGDFPEAIVRWVPAADRPVFRGAGDKAWDRKIRERGWILADGGTYHLWYTGYNDDRSPTRFLGHATSIDGLNWTRDPANPIHDSSWVEDVCVVRRDGTFFLFAEGKGDIAHLLTSTDGVHWDEKGPLDVRKSDGTPITPGPFGTPTAWFEGGTWNLFYERGDQAVWLARSTDGKVWTNVQDAPVLSAGPEGYDRAAIAINQVIRRDGTYYAFYHANTQRPVRDWAACLATVTINPIAELDGIYFASVYAITQRSWADWTTCVARSNDLIHWEKYAGNPILNANCSSGILVDGPRGRRFYTMHPDVRVFVNPPSDGHPQR